MSFRLILAAAALALPVLPVAAQSVTETHREVAMPAGKMTKLYRPVTRADCTAEHRHHQSGKMAYVPVVKDAGCAAELAKRDAKTRVASR